MGDRKKQITLSQIERYLSAHNLSMLARCRAGTWQVSVYVHGSSSMASGEAASLKGAVAKAMAEHERHRQPHINPPHSPLCLQLREERKAEGRPVSCYDDCPDADCGWAK